ncbi:MAG: hypothetical protein WCH83_17245 [Alphaproteobacteria bacterium]|jgi:hypothetical protein
MRATFALTFSIVAMTVATVAPASAGGDCINCFRREVSPPQYGVVHETVQVRPAHTIAHRIPAQVGVVHETVQVRPAAVVAHRIPAQVGVVHETVQVSGASRGWQRSYDAHGREILCEVVTPARYATVARTVVTRPEQVVHQTIPAQYGTVARTVVTRPEQVVHQTIPAQYGTVARTVQVAPASERWVQVSPRRERVHHHGHHVAPRGYAPQTYREPSYGPVTARY